MRCWDCDKLIVVPEASHEVTTGPERIRSRRPQVLTIEVTCNCGTRYQQVTSKLPGKANKPRPEQSDADKEKGRLWRGED